MTKFSSTKESSLKFFIEVLRAYGLDKSRSNIQVKLDQTRIEFKITKKEEQHQGIENLNLLMVIEEPQELYQQRSNVSIAKGKSEVKETKV